MSDSPACPEDGVVIRPFDRHDIRRGALSEAFYALMTRAEHAADEWAGLMAAARTVLELSGVELERMTELMERAEVAS